MLKKNMWLMTITCCFVMSALIVMLSVCYSHQLWICCVQNLVNIIFFGVTIPFIFSRKFKANIWLPFAVSLIMIQAFIAFLCIGWNGGFQYFFFGSFAVAYCNSILSMNRSKSNKRFLALEILSAVLFILCLYLSRNMEPVYSAEEKNLSEGLLWYISIFNTILVFTVLIIMSNSNVKILKRSIKVLKEEASVDELTGLYNRHFMRSVFDKIISDFESYEYPYAIAIFDIDNFKQVNDNYGHETGDKVLKEIAEVMNNNEDGQVYFCRWGGEEFLAVQQLHEGYDQFVAKMEAIRVQIQKLNIGKINVTITCGVATNVADDKNTLHELISLADRRLYIGKKYGKNVVISTGDSQIAAGEISTEQ